LSDLRVEKKKRIVFSWNLNLFRYQSISDLNQPSKKVLLSRPKIG
jgi:hypothetical protein